MLCRSVALIPFGLLVLTLTTGCGGDPLGRHAISGAVKVDGAPLGQGNIQFEPTQGATTAAGAPVKDGTYSIESDKGLPNGKYRVVINAPVPGTGGQVTSTENPGDPVAPPKELIPPAWNLKSDQFIEVKADGPFEFNFDIDTKKK